MKTLLKAAGLLIAGLVLFTGCDLENLASENIPATVETKTPEVETETPEVVRVVDNSGQNGSMSDLESQAIAMLEALPPTVEAETPTVDKVWLDIPSCRDAMDRVIAALDALSDSWVAYKEVAGLSTIAEANDSLENYRLSPHSRSEMTPAEFAAFEVYQEAWSDYSDAHTAYMECG